ncbi:MAG: DUF362 domain-containing protein [Candidatus Methanofastidiosia archaeon]
MVSKVAIVELNKDVQETFKQVLKLIGGIDDLNTKKRHAIIKPGIFNHKKKNHPTVSVVSAIINSFNKAPQIFIAESDNYKGIGSERLQIYKKLFTERVIPFNLSEDVNTKEVNIAGEIMGFSHILFKSNVFVSTHALRKYDKGTILKNLLGLILERKKVRFHKKLVPVLLDIYEAIGGIDLAVLDATYTYVGRKGIKTNFLLVGRDAIAVEAVGATLVGLNPEKMPVIHEATNRGLGEGNVKRIEVLGNSIESLKEKFHQLK